MSLRTTSTRNGVRALADMVGRAQAAITVAGDITPRGAPKAVFVPISQLPGQDRQLAVRGL
jgi:hypothetical protein